MVKKKRDGALILLGLLFTILGAINLYLHYIKKVNLTLGDVLIDTNITGIFLLVVGVLSLLLDYLSR